MAKSKNSSTEIADQITKAMIAAEKERGRLNLIVAGRSGVGKSSLINAVFGEELARTGQGKPVTKGVREISKPGVPLSIWDTEGLEIERYSETMEGLAKLIEERARDVDPDRRIHAAWLCVQEDGRRIEEGESRMQELFAANMPVIAVITKARNDGGFQKVVEELLPLAKRVVRVRALSENFDDGYAIPSMGVLELVHATEQLVADRQKKALAAAQNASLKLKIEEAERHIAEVERIHRLYDVLPYFHWVNMFSGSVLGSKAKSLSQIKMLQFLSSIFDVESRAEVEEESFRLFNKHIESKIGLQRAVSNSLNMFPGFGFGVGTLTGKALGVATVAELVNILGLLYLLVLSELWLNTPEQLLEPDRIVDAFSKKLESAELKAPWNKRVQALSEQIHALIEADGSEEGDAGKESEWRAQKRQKVS